MITVPVKLGERSYNIIISPGLLEQCPAQLANLINKRKCAIITDDNVARLYGDSATKMIRNANAESAMITFPAGEEHKTLATVGDFCRDLAAAQFDRSAFIAAVGGGVTGDLAGFAAAIYMRGIDFIQVPTTLLAMVDSSVGGKTGADLPEGKNLVGAFWQPRLVLIDPLTLQTLPEKEIRCGLAEIVKYGVIMDKVLFADLENNITKLKQLDIDYYMKVIAKCCELKADVVGNDERENGRRAILNYGHTFGHAIELVSNFTLAHGEAIAIGMNIAAEMAVVHQLATPADAARQRELLLELGLPVKIPHNLNTADIYNGMSRDKKKIGGTIKFIIPRAIGSVEINGGFERDTVIAAMDKCHE